MLQSVEDRTEQLNGMTVDMLRAICKEKGISYYEHSKRLTKVAMVERIVSVEYKPEDEQQQKGTISDCGNSGICLPIDCMVGEDDKKPFELPDETINEIEEKKRLENKKKYVEQAKIGTLVAFKIPNGRVISAAITKKSTSNRKFLVETKYGAEYKISFDDVLWVRTNTRWPRGIYLLFKKNKGTEVSDHGEKVNQTVC